MTVDLPLLPRPRQLSRTAGSCRVDAATRLQIGLDAGEATRKTARDLQSALGERFGFAPPIVPTGAPRAEQAISLVLPERDGAAFAAAGIEWAAPGAEGAQGYTLRIDERGTVVAANDEAGLFYGTRTLIQIAALCGRIWPGLAIADRPALPHRGLMLDISRGKVPTRARLIELVYTLAHYKINHLQLYTEHAFRFPTHPEIGADGGGLTPDDLLALDAACRERHVELVPNLQSLGHQQALLRLPRYAHLAETSWNWSLATVREETFHLLDELYGDLLPCFSSRWLNVNADEPWDMGLGQSLPLTREIGPGGVYLRHVLRLHALAAKHGRRMMLWADVLKHYPKLVDQLPDDILLLDWWYEATPNYATLEALAASGRPFWICPGTSSWTALFPRLENAIDNILTYTRQGIAAGDGGMLLTDWGDGGHYQPLSNSWHPYLWGAETAWSGGATPAADFDAAFGRLFLGERDGALTAALRRLGAAMQTERDWLITWNSAMALFEEPLLGRLAATTPPATIAEARAAAEAIPPLLDGLPDRAPRHDLGMIAAQIVFAAEKVATTGAIRALLAELATHTAPTADGRARFDALLASLRRQRDRLPALVAEFETRWLAQAQRSGIRITLDRYAALLDRYDAALAWLAAQRAAYERGEPVDATLASYDRAGYAVIYEATYRWVMELVAIVGTEALPPDLQEWLATVGPIVEGTAA